MCDIKTFQHVKRINISYVIALNTNLNDTKWNYFSAISMDAEEVMIFQTKCTPSGIDNAALVRHALRLHHPIWCHCQNDDGFVNDSIYPVSK